MFTKYQIFSALLLLVSLLTLGTLLIRGGRRLKFSELEKAMNGGDDGKKKKITMDDDN
jgi:hypothetical protein